MYLRDAYSRALPDGWKNRPGVPTCGQCLASVHNFRRHVHKLSEIQKKKSEQTSSFMPSLELVKSRLAYLFCKAMNERDDCQLAVDKIKEDQDALDCVAILSSRKAMNILVKANKCTYRLFECHSANFLQLVAKKFREDNYLLCRSCKGAKFNEAQSQRNREARGDELFSLNSKTILRHLEPK